MLNLDNITLLAISGRNNEQEFKENINALIYSMKKINFQNIKILSPNKPSDIIGRIEFCQIKEINSYAKYQDFCVKQLNSYVDTPFVLTIQSDGFVINPHLWDNSFLDYDYCGAPWRHDKHYEFIRVGNGGFSLRSKKFLEICQNECPSFGQNEDHNICITFKDIFLEKGIKYAQLEIASKFSFENKMDDINNSLETSFGFHGKGNLELIKQKMLISTDNFEI